MLEVRLLGKFEIKCDGNPVTISSRAAQSLFAYLILTAGTSHRREKLAGMFWPDATEEKARAYLRHELWRVRKALPPQEKVDYLIADDINLSFDASAEYWSDVATLENLSESISIEELKTALSVFQGELLPGFYDEWIILEREHLQAVFEHRIVHLLKLLESEKRWQDILEWAEHWISFGQGPEAAYRYLMTAYDALGDRAKVSSTYERCVKALHDLDLEPSEQTRALAFRRTHSLNIPIPLTSFIGREKELKEVADLFSKSRLVTLTGSGGVGKTRLAIQIVAEVLNMFPDGIWFLDLAPLSDPELVPNALANLLGLRESGELSITDILINYFRSRTALVIFDNCEHLIDACALLMNSLLISCEHLSILATSRETLRISGEIPYRVPSLEMPGLEIEFVVDDLIKIESVRLFVERTTIASANFAVSQQNGLTIAQICQRLDGIPLAIELAAARINVLTVEQILKRLDNRFNLLTSGLRSVLPRHQTLRAMIEWSYDLLSEKERLLFRRLAVFMGGWTLEAAEEVCSGNSLDRAEILDSLAQLVNKSLVFIETNDGMSRYRRLETIRQFARERLFETAEVISQQERHFEYFLKLAETAEPHLIQSGQLEWLPLLDADYDNLRAGLQWALVRKTAESSLRICAALGRYWEIRSLWKEGSKWLESALAKPAQNLNSAEKAARVKALFQYSALAADLDDRENMMTAAELSLKLATEGQDQRNIAIATFYVGLAAHGRGDTARARKLMEQSFAEFQKLNDPYWQAFSYKWLSGLLVDQGDLESAERNLQYLGLARKAGDRLLLANCLISYPRSLFSVKGQDEAIKYAEEADLLFKQMGQSFNDSLFVLAEIAWWKGDTQKAKQLLLKLQEGFEIQGDKYRRSDVIADLGLLAMEEGNLSAAEEYFELALATAKELEDRIFMSWRLAELANIHCLRNNVELFKNTVKESIFLAKEIANAWKIHPLILIINSLYFKESNISAHIIGTIDAFFQRVGDLMFDPLPIGHYYYAAESHAHKVLGDEAFELAFNEGYTMSLDEGLDLALKAVEDL